MTQISTPSAARLPVPQLVRHSGAEAVLLPDAPWRGELQRMLDLLDLRKCRLDLRITPVADGFTLTGMLGATVVQPCVVTLAPVTTRIDAPVTRTYLGNLPEPEGEEMEMPEDDSLEPLGSLIDLGALLVEALALNLPDYPRSRDASLPPEALDDDDSPDPEEAPRKPFSGLSSLKDKLQDPSEDKD